MIRAPWRRQVVPVLAAFLVLFSPPSVAGEQAAAGASIPQPPIEALADGLDATLSKAADRLATRPSEAPSVLDAALRASEVASSAEGASFDEVHELVRQARSAVQDGDKAIARKAIRRASTRLRAPPLPGSEVRLPGAIARYEGATVIDRFGARIGEVVDVAERDGGPMLRLALGKRDAAGAIAPDGRLVWVEPQALVFGRLRPASTALVAWPGAPAG